MIYRETNAELPEYDGHHIQITLADFSGPHKKLLERGLIAEESDQHQYRFLDIVDVDTNKPLFRIEHDSKPTDPAAVHSSAPLMSGGKPMRLMRRWRG